MQQVRTLMTIGSVTMRELIVRLMAAIETPDDLSDDDVIFLLEDAHLFVEGLEDDERQ
jgi:hypothetical protein